MYRKSHPKKLPCKVPYPHFGYVNMLVIYEGFGDARGMLQGYVGILLERNYFVQSWIAQPPSVAESFLVMGLNS